MESIGEKFKTGAIVCTPGVQQLMQDEPSFRMFVHESLLRHTLGDWGDLTKEDENENETALTLGLRLFSAYVDTGHPKIWIITEADRSSTCVLLPTEY